MLTLQHSLITLLSLDGDIEKFKQIIPYVLLPDAIRRYTGARQTSHFEENSNKSDISWLQYPLDLKTMNKENQALLTKSHLADNIRPCCIGENTIIPAFEKYNKHLPLIYYSGVKMHLTQDFIYDDFIRQHIDCSKKYDNIFVINGNTVDDKEIRHFITEIEEDGIAILARWIYNKLGIKANQQWFDENVHDVIAKVYSQDLTIGTYSYMKIRKDIDEAITTQDWTKVHFNKTIKLGDYTLMYNKVLNLMNEIEMDLNFRTYKVVGTVRNNNKIVAVDILKCNGKTQRIQVDKFKRILSTNNNVFVTNAKLSSDNRLLIS